MKESSTVKAVLGLSALALLGSSRKSSATPSSIRVMTWNIQNGFAAPMKEGAFNAQRQFAFINAQTPDILFLQEAEEKGGILPFESLRNKMVRFGQLAILLGPRVKLKSSRPHGKHIQQVRVTVDGRSLTLINFHLSRFDKKARLEEMQTLSELVAERKANKASIILAGDANASLTLPGLVKATSGFTFPTLPPADPKTRAALVASSDYDINDSDLSEEIDYIWVSNPLRIKEAAILTNAADRSDHFPIGATIQLG